MKSVNNPRMTEDEKSRVEDFAEAILHGDESHRAWLLAAAEAFNTGKPIPKQPELEGIGPGQSATTADMDPEHPWGGNPLPLTPPPATSLFESVVERKDQHPKGFSLLVPLLQPFQFGHGRDPIRKRAELLDKVRQKLYEVQEWLNKEAKYLHASCLGHVFPSDCRDPGGGGGFCKDCGMANPRG